MRILCDTHVLIWLLEDNPRLPGRVRQLLMASDTELFFSSVSIYEISVKHALKPESMPCSPEEVRQLAMVAGVGELVFNSSHARLAGELPWLHRDPFDRMLIAQAQMENMVLLSHDDYVKQYGDMVFGF